MARTHDDQAMDLTWSILMRLTLGPSSYEHLLRWVRIQRPRIVPEAVGASLSELCRHGLIECIAQKWQVQPFQRMKGFK